jgi:dihydroorotate dehydrogenase
MQVLLSLLLVILPLIGIADSAYITYEKLQNIVPPCGAGFDCGTVLNSSYAQIGPIPISALGLLYYSTLFVLGIGIYLELDIVSLFSNKKLRPYTEPKQLYTTITTFGLFFSLYLVFLMAFVLEAWCLYCIVSAVVSLVTFTVSWWYFKKTTNHSHLLIKLIIQSILSTSYSYLLKPILFLVDPETVHNLFTFIGRILGSNVITRTLTSSIFNFKHTSLTRTHTNITFANPIGLAAGFDYTGTLAPILGSVGFGFHTIGTITLEPYEGNPKPRLSRFPKSKALLVNKGLKNPGAKIIINHLANKKFSAVVGISIASTNKLFATEQEQIMDMIQSFMLFEKSTVRHSYYELNISCPNTFGGEPFTTPNRLAKLLKAIDALKLSRPLFLKMPIDQTEEETIALLTVAAKHTVQGIIIGNLTKDKQNPDMDNTERAIWKTKPGNVSGKPTFKKSNALIKATRTHFKNRFTIIGCGGVFDIKTAQAKLDAGADLIQLVTGMIYQGPQLIGILNRKLAFKE